MHARWQNFKSKLILITGQNIGFEIDKELFNEVHLIEIDILYSEKLLITNIDIIYVNVRFNDEMIDNF